MDCHTRELLGCHLSGAGKAATATSALEHALIARFGTLGRVERAFLLRSESGLVFNVAKVHGTGSKLPIAPGAYHTVLPQQNGLMQRLIR